MAKQQIVADKEDSYPALNVAFCETVFINEIQIHQGAALTEEVPTLESDMPRDVISMSKEQAVALAHLILENV